MRIVGILLAAGRSERFGSDKLVAPLPRSSDDVAAGTPLGVAACRHLVAAIPETVAVVRVGDRHLSELLRSAGARVVECADAHDGMAASLACGVHATSDADGWIIALADMPWIKPATIEKLVARLAGGADIVAPSFKGQRGHPVGFAKRHGPMLAALHGDEGARSIIVVHNATLQIQDSDDVGVIRDIDAPGDIT